MMSFYDFIIKKFDLTPEALQPISKCKFVTYCITNYKLMFMLFVNILSNNLNHYTLFKRFKYFFCLKIFPYIMIEELLWNNRCVISIFVVFTLIILKILFNTLVLLFICRAKAFVTVALK